MNIAVVGRGCVLPGAHSHSELWERILHGDTGYQGENTVGADFDMAFDDRDLHIDVTGAAPHIRWTIHAARAALAEAGLEAGERTGLVLGHLSLPSSTFLNYVRPTGDADPLHRFHTGASALLPARALGLGARSYSVDAACAAALYALKFACDELLSGQADVMLAGGCNGSDPDYLHRFFTLVDALSPQGLSRPFHHKADGMVPSPGVGLVALMRLPDARAHGARILGVIRGVGLSNDGRGKGLVSPDGAGQVGAMRRAYAAAGVAPETVSLLECHATGTAVGDAAEIASITDVFGDSADLPIGSSKANFGHTLNAAGAVGLLKVLAAMEAGVRPLTPLDGEVLDELTEASPLRLLRSTEPWPGERRAAVSAFGFGGCNAHVIVDEAAADAEQPAEAPATPRTVAVVAMETVAGQPITELEVNLIGLRFPPNDMRDCLPQGVLMLETARKALARTAVTEDAMVVVGLGCDPGAATLLHTPDAGPASSLGAMANIVASRISSQFDLKGPSLAVSLEEASGHLALDLAVRAIAAGEVDSAVVGAVDLSCDPAHRRAVAGLGFEREAADASVVLVLKAIDVARRDGDRVLAIVGSRDAEPPHVVHSGGESHAAQGLLAMSDAVRDLSEGRYRSVEIVAEPMLAAPWSVVLSAGDPAPATGGPGRKRAIPRPAHPPVFDRVQLERLATGPISAVFGPLFARQDTYPRQTRMPAPPMLLVDRVTRLDAEPGGMGLGTLWSQTEVRADSWFLDPHARVPAGHMVEAGQANLLLSSWLGIDLRHAGDRVYRLLGGEIEFHGPAAQAGETLTFEVCADGHAVAGDVRLFLFHYQGSVDGDPRVSMWAGQAGFFTADQLANSQGVQWDSSQLAPPAQPLGAPVVQLAARSFDDDRIRAFAHGREADCFGSPWPRVQSGPRVTEPQHLLFDRVPEFDPSGGPHGAGYLRAQLDIVADAWFFDGHLVDDPCMPATVMFQGCVQAMAFYLAALGHTLERPGARFELATGRRYPMVCRRQVTPANQAVDFEVFVTGHRGGDAPELVADVLVTGDGVKSFLVRGLCLRLVSQPQDESGEGEQS
ncbi:beta-ketoacyl synthase N-terminal-like domain-containing protein [Nocardia tengchongensis]|uniref:hotdog fold thioesterase n=1 Tax=Nocardia tengchongensis TaxID=2055889 RepID=UPI00368B6E1B